MYLIIKIYLNFMFLVIIMTHYDIYQETLKKNIYYFINQFIMNLFFNLIKIQLDLEVKYKLLDLINFIFN